MSFHHKSYYNNQPNRSPSEDTQMESETPNKKDKPKRTAKALIEIEWEVIDELQNKLKNPDLTTSEYAKLSRSLASHINNLKKLLDTSEIDEYDRQTLGDYVVNVRPRIFRWQEHDRRPWKRRLTFRR